MKKTIPTFNSDREAEEFVDNADLAKYDLSGGTVVQFEFAAKGAQLNMRVPQPLLDAVKAQAKAQGIPYTGYIRKLMEQAVTRPH